MQRVSSKAKGKANKQNRKSGLLVEESFRVTQGLVSGILLLCNDTNELHSDRCFAREQGFNDIIAPGVLILGRVAGCISRVFPDGTLARSFDSVKFSSPAYVGDKLTIYIIINAVKQVGTRELVNLSFDVENQDEKSLVSGECRIWAPIKKL